MGSRWTIIGCMRDIRIRRTSATDPEFVHLVGSLDAFLAELNGEQHSFYSQHNRSESLAGVLVASRDGEPVGCGAFRRLDEAAAEIKRMFVLPAERGAGIGRTILDSLEADAVEAGCSYARLETSKRLEAAVRLYSTSGYAVIPNYGPYAGVEDSVCMEKDLRDRLLTDDPMNL